MRIRGRGRPPPQEPENSSPREAHENSTRRMRASVQHRTAAVRAAHRHLAEAEVKHIIYIFRAHVLSPGTVLSPQKPRKPTVGLKPEIRVLKPDRSGFENLGFLDRFSVRKPRSPGAWRRRVASGKTLGLENSTTGDTFPRWNWEAAHGLSKPRKPPKTDNRFLR